MTLNLIWEGDAIDTTLVELKSLKSSDKLQHFILTRVYHQQADLWDKCCLIEPLRKRETVPSFDELVVVVFSQNNDGGTVEQQDLMEFAESS